VFLNVVLISFLIAQNYAYYQDLAGFKPVFSVPDVHAVSTAPFHQGQ
jgi:hypothetical protein